MQDIFDKKCNIFETPKNADTIELKSTFLSKIVASLFL